MGQLRTRIIVKATTHIYYNIHSYVHIYLIQYQIRKNKCYMYLYEIILMKRKKKNERKGVMGRDGRMSRRYKLLRISPYHSYPQNSTLLSHSLSPLTSQPHLPSFLSSYLLLYYFYSKYCLGKFNLSLSKLIFG